MPRAWGARESIVLPLAVWSDAMIPDDDLELCKQREAAERAAAAAANNPIARGIHNELADQYAERHRSLSISAADGEVTISNASGTVASLTPNEAVAAADMLMAKGREAGRNKPK